MEPSSKKTNTVRILTSLATCSTDFHAGGTADRNRSFPGRCRRFNREPHLLLKYLEEYDRGGGQMTHSSRHAVMGIE